ncbi:aminotransferase class V-fold PLP-dependent enzyme [Catalinimonas niigatensis]|uniref:aminotransferase class V-fold PLP-dependent enzyme n=1 Tax=Catalinimonas niigatensis TaxID=1397264 RepID=UPI002664EAD6|nr:aminotransferase class V-fold PLP-dependent enzyme [Catalinimonas niigatensis]WPP48633.1 aminotransferase class V-fold PLP-dependent enzyme [Catalinimonas niigatensis]
MMNRRNLLKRLASLPVVGGLLGSSIPLQSLAKPGIQAKQSLFKELGIRPLINARGTMTFLSGSLMEPEVVAAINETSRDFANMHEVEDKVGERIAEMLECEAAMVTSGAACALTIGTAAAITGVDMEKIRQIPNLPGPQPEVIIQKKHRYVFDQAVRSAGVKLVEVETPKEMEEAINERTVMSLFFNGAVDWYGIEDSINHEDFVAISKRNNIPSFIDAAADVPPVENLFKYQKMGFDMVTFSGGKMIRGPQSAGLLFGRKDLIEAAKLNFSPHESPIGRSMKVNKEEIFGMYVALKHYLEKDHEKEWQEWQGRVDHIAAKVETVNGVKGETHIPKGRANVFPGLNIHWDQSKVKITPEEVVEALRKGEPSIETSAGDDELWIAVVTLQPEHVDIVARRIKEVLETAV